MRSEVADHPARILIVDDGCGIDPQISERIFERLYQVPEPREASRKGLGLGLYICKELVTRQGGKIWLKGQPQKGSTFAFTLPVFSLNDFISPLLKNHTWPAESVALLVVKIGLLKARHSKESQEQWYHEARGLLERCLMPNLDVLQPNMSQGRTQYLRLGAIALGYLVMAWAAYSRHYERFYLETARYASLVISLVGAVEIAHRVHGGEGELFGLLTVYSISLYFLAGILYRAALQANVAHAHLAASGDDGRCRSFQEVQRSLRPPGGG